jgi:DNA-directed RNA polymerase alpha subunit
MKYKEIKLVPMSAVRAMFNPSLGEAAPVRVDGATTLICQGDSEETVNEYLANGWELIQFVTHHSTEKDATAVVAVLGKPYGYNDVSIDTLGLPLRAVNILKAEGIYAISALANRSEIDLIKINNMGRKTLNHIKEILRERGLALRGS